MKHNIIAVLSFLTVTAAAMSASTQDGAAVQTAAGAGGALAGGFGGLVVGTAGSLLFGPGELEPAPPVAGMVIGAATGLVAGVTASGNALGGSGTAGGTLRGAAAGAATTAAFAGLIHLVSRGKPSPGLQQTFVVSMIALPLTGAVVGYGVSF